MKLRKIILTVPMMTVLTGFSQSVIADDWGCQVLLCLSDPRGPTTESECKPPIHKLWDHLARGKSFPSCSLAGDSRTGTGSFARQVYDPYDPCPEGLVPAGGYISTGIGRTNYQWSVMGRNNDDDTGRHKEATQRACVGNYVGSYNYRKYNDDDSITVREYDRVEWQSPKNPRAIDVYIDGKLHQRVRY